jgi:hypothetical protein
VVSDGGKVLRQAGTGSELARMFGGETGWTDDTLRARVRATDLTAAGAAAGLAARATGASRFQRLVLVRRCGPARGDTRVDRHHPRQPPTGRRRDRVAPAAARRDRHPGAGIRRQRRGG